MDQNTHCPERSDSPGDRAHVYHVAGDVAEEGGRPVSLCTAQVKRTSSLA